MLVDRHINELKLYFLFITNLFCKKNRKRLRV